MGQKVNPIGFRIGVTKDWRSRWFSRKKDFGTKLYEDQVIRKILADRLKEAAIARVNIERFANRVRITLFSARPGLVIGRKGKDIEILKALISKKISGKEVFIDIVEVKKPEVDATLVANSIAQQLERRVSFRRAMKKAMQLAMDSGAEGIKVKCSGRLGGADLARIEQYSEGKVPLHTITANIDYCHAEANTLAGIIGIKVWICKPKNLEQQNGPNAKARKVQKGTKRKPRR